MSPFPWFLWVTFLRRNRRWNGSPGTISDVVVFRINNHLMYLSRFFVNVLGTSYCWRMYPPWRVRTCTEVYNGITKIDCSIVPFKIDCCIIPLLIFKGTTPIPLTPSFSKVRDGIQGPIICHDGLSWSLWRSDGPRGRRRGVVTWLLPPRRPRPICAEMVVVWSFRPLTATCRSVSLRNNGWVR